MKPIMSPQALNDLGFWIKAKPRLVAKIIDLIKECAETPFDGLGKPEPLRHQLDGVWSRRIDEEHRLLYRVSGSGDGQTVEIVSCRFRYARR